MIYRISRKVTNMLIQLKLMSGLVQMRKTLIEEIDVLLPVKRVEVLWTHRRRSWTYAKLPLNIDTICRSLVIAHSDSMSRIKSIA